MRKTLILVAALGVILGVAAYVEYGRKPRMSGPLPSPPFPSVENGTAATSDGDETATFGGGCFWCTEAVFQRMKGVKSVLPGYSGGQTKNPTYEEVCTGTTGHAEAIQIVFDPTQVSYGDLLQVFWATHDPTTLNRQGHDFGTQYRSVIFWHFERQKKLAEEYKQKIADAKVFDAPLVTEIAPFEQFYVAEDYHQNFFAKNPQQGYCQLTIPPKLAKLEKLFPTRLKGTQETAK